MDRLSEPGKRQASPPKSTAPLLKPVRALLQKGIKGNKNTLATPPPPQNSQPATSSPPSLQARSMGGSSQVRLVDVGNVNGFTGKDAFLGPPNVNAKGNQTPRPTFDTTATSTKLNTPSVVRHHDKNSCRWKPRKLQQFETQALEVSMVLF